MKLEEILKGDTPPKKGQLTDEDLIRFFMKYKGLLKERERDKAYWAATNENLKLAYEKLDEKDKELERTYSIIQGDLSVAEKIQQSLLPVLLDEMKSETDLVVYHKQLLEVGGDYYDFFKTRNERYAIGVFDISGHGVSAALVMTYLKALFMQILGRLDSPKKIVEWVNSTSYGFLRSVKKYATFTFVVFYPKKIHYICGGGFGFLVHGNELFSFNKRDHFLGLRDKPFHEYELPFTRGDLMVLYTDGIVEAQNEKNEDYTVLRLKKIIMENADKSVDDLLTLCLKDYQEFRNTDSDDLTLLILRKKV